MDKFNINWKDFFLKKNNMYISFLYIQHSKYIESRLVIDIYVLWMYMK